MVAGPCNGSPPAPAEGQNLCRRGRGCPWRARALSEGKASAGEGGVCSWRVRALLGKSLMSRAATTCLETTKNEKVLVVLKKVLRAGALPEGKGAPRGKGAFGKASWRARALSAKPLGRRGRSWRARALLAKPLGGRWCSRRARALLAKPLGAASCPSICNYDLERTGIAEETTAPKNQSCMGIWHGGGGRS